MPCDFKVAPRRGSPFYSSRRFFHQTCRGVILLVEQCVHENTRLFTIPLFASSDLAENAPMSLDPLAWQQWLGRTERGADQVSAGPVAAMAATLDRDDLEPVAGTEVPPLWHWIFFTPCDRQSDLGEDGHARRGGFLPPVPLPRRMWAGGRLDFQHPLRIGDRIERSSRIADIRFREGHSGPLVFVTVRHEISNPQGVAIVEEHDVVYRDAARPSFMGPAPQTAPTGESFSREVAPDPVLLFRYSALTFNGHRIHYDRSYAGKVEGYPGLVVHGPLVATLLLELLRRQVPNARVRRFSFKAVGPLYDIHRFTLCGRAEGENAYALWARDHEGALAMHASVEVA
jgi:3-methylfumaryl-CoA hydratase